MMFLAFSITSLGLGFIRYIGAGICNLIYGLIARLFQLFMIVSQLNILSSDEIAPIYQRVTLILTIVMVFYITFEFVKYVVQPDNMTDKEKGVGNIVTRIMIAIVLIAFVPRIFTMAYDVQNKLITNQVFSKIILGNKNIQFDTFGSSFSADMLGVFYGMNEEACGGSNYDNECKEAEQKVQENLRQLREDGKVTLIPGITGTKKMTVDGEKEDVALIRFDGLMAIIVGGVILYLIVLYTIDVGTRYAQLLFLQIMSPIAIIGYISPKKDNIFSKWLKQCITTYLDLFIRLSIIYFVLLIIDVLGDSFNSGSLFAGIQGVEGYKTLAYIALVMGLLVFANKAPKMIGELLPGGGAASIGYGLKGADRVAPMAARAIGMSASGLNSMARQGIARAGKEIGRRNEIKDKLRKEGKPTDRRTMRRALAVDRTQRKQAKKDLGAKSKKLKTAHEEMIAAENKLKTAELKGMDASSPEYLALKNDFESKRQKWENVKNNKVSQKTQEALENAEKKYRNAQVTGVYKNMTEQERAALDKEVKDARDNWLKEAGYDEAERAYQLAAAREAESSNNDLGARIGWQVAGAALSGLATGAKIGSQATSLGDISKKINEAQKNVLESEKNRIEWLSSGGGATIKAYWDKQITEWQQKFGIETTSERIKITVKKLETDVKEIDSQINMESNVKKGQDSAEDRSSGKIKKHEQKITIKANDDPIQPKGFDKAIETYTIDSNGVKKQKTTSQIHMEYEEKANTARAQADAANAELVKAELNGTATDALRETVAQKNKEAEQAKFREEQVLKSLKEYAITRALRGDIPPEEIDAVLSNQIEAMKQAMETARNNAKSVEFLRNKLLDPELMKTNKKQYEKNEELFNKFINGNIDSFSTYDDIQGLLTGHTGALTIEKNKYNETIRAINESAATAAANANASGSGTKK